jgi:hypothetical protein
VDYRLGLGFHALRLEMCTVNVPRLTNAQLSLLTQSQLNFIVSLLGSTQVQLMNAGQVQDLSNTQVGQLSNAQVDVLTNSQITALVNSQLGNLSEAQLQYILASVMTNQFIQNNLSITQRNSVNEINPLQSGQIISFLAWDDGNLQHGRLLNFNTLKTNNIFGNNSRFTDINGLQAYANTYVIDHATGLGWCKTVQGLASWSETLTNATAFTIGSLANFFLPGIKEIFDIINFSLFPNPFNYAPFSFNNSNMPLWTSTTVANSTVNAYVITAATTPVNAFGKTTLCRSLFCRKHF